MMDGVASEGTGQKPAMIDAIYLKAQHAASLVRTKKGGLIRAGV